MFKKTLSSLIIVGSLALGACGPQQAPPPPPAETATPVAPPPAAAPAAAPRPRPERRVEREPEYAPPPPPVCGDCGTIVSVQEERVAGQATALGTLGGAGAGAAAGGQFGKKSGKFAMMALGAVGGAFASREVESQVRAKDVYHVVVNMEAGGTREVTVDQLNGLGVGTKVHVNGDNTLSYAN